LCSGSRTYVRQGDIHSIQLHGTEQFEAEALALALMLMLSAKHLALAFARLALAARAASASVVAAGSVVDGHVGHCYG